MVDLEWSPQGYVDEGILLNDGVVMPWDFVHGLVFHDLRGRPYHTFRSDRAGKYVKASGTNYATIAAYVIREHSTYVFTPSEQEM